MRRLSSALLALVALAALVAACGDGDDEGAEVTDAVSTVTTAGPAGDESGSATTTVTTSSPATAPPTTAAPTTAPPDPDPGATEPSAPTDATGGGTDELIAGLTAEDEACVLAGVEPETAAAFEEDQPSGEAFVDLFTTFEECGIDASPAFAAELGVPVEQARCLLGEPALLGAIVEFGEPTAADADAATLVTAVELLVGCGVDLAQLAELPEGVTGEQAACLFTSLPPETLQRAVSGADPTSEDLEVFFGVIADCGIPVEALAGQS